MNGDCSTATSEESHKKYTDNIRGENHSGKPRMRQRDSVTNGCMKCYVLQVKTEAGRGQLRKPGLDMSCSAIGMNEQS